MTYIAAANVVQTAQGQRGQRSATLLITWTTGTQTPDVVEVYWRRVSETEPQPPTHADTVAIGSATPYESRIQVPAPEDLEISLYPRMTAPNGVVLRQQPDESGQLRDFDYFGITKRHRTQADHETGPPIPTLAVVAKYPKTRDGDNRITISWSSNNYNEGHIDWGPKRELGARRELPNHHKLDPRGGVYHGQFTTNRPLVPGLTYLFRVRVINSWQGNVWKENELETDAVHSVRSVKQFLAQSGLPSTGSVLQALQLATPLSMRRLMGLG